VARLEETFSDEVYRRRKIVRRNMSEVHVTLNMLLPREMELEIILEINDVKLLNTELILKGVSSRKVNQV